ncbi:transcriptional regulator MtlR [Amylibacter ulvae]|uniref:Transcriptional regulator MtlR n=1 Tax=Paramylibacter ulvae TaxID=1651968 RepID=A0ABQ3D105_9RHOB|nr:AraC family transcriptional regulator [Amylibacter ulvae]GHA53080.1 transcriptional regulator MtlR [Amylibacter ulvae]
MTRSPILVPELEIIPEQDDSLIYLEHGWPNPLCRWHSHQECELHLILATTGRAYVGDYIGDFAPGGLFLTGPHLPHNWITDEVWTEPVEERDMVIQFDQDRLMQLIKAFPEFAGINQVLKEAESGLEWNGFDLGDMQERFAYIRDNTGSNQIMAFLDFLLEISRNKDRKTLSVAKLYHENRNPRQMKICEVVDYIVERFADDISVEKAADIAGMSPTTFSRNFRTVTGNRFVEFVNRVRIGQACSLLYATDEQVSSICFDVGYQNLANFNRHFQKMKNMTPSEYRELAQDELLKTERSAS